MSSFRPVRDTPSVKVSLRAAGAADAEFLTEMLVHAAFWRSAGPAGSVAEVLRDPNLSHYVSRWPQDGDLGIIAHSQRPVGAAWLRFFTADDPGYGFVNAATPEVSVGVQPPSRGRGVGTLLLQALITASRQAGLPALSLSVEADNDARRLYERAGFDQVGSAGGSLTMVLYL